MTAAERWRTFFRAHPCDCDPKAPAKDRCNLSGWIRCDRRWQEWRAAKEVKP